MALELKKEGLAPVGGEIRIAPPEERVIIESPEAAEAEVAEMQLEDVEQPAAEQVPTPAPVSEPKVERAAPVEKDRFRKEIEAVLSEDLGELYKQMPPDKQKAFRERGEKIAAAIQQMLQ